MNEYPRAFNRGSKTEGSVLMTKLNLLLVLTTTVFLIGGKASAHPPESFEMSFDAWLGNFDNPSVVEPKVIAYCNSKNGVNGPYQEVDLGDSLHLHKNTKGEYEIAMNGWLNTLGIRSGDADYVSHRKPRYPRRFGIDPSLEQVFRNMGATGEFELIVEVNSIKEGTVWHQGRRRGALYESSGDPAGSHAKVQISNPQIIRECFSFNPCTWNLGLRRLLKCLIGKEGVPPG